MIKMLRAWSAWAHSLAERRGLLNQIGAVAIGHILDGLIVILIGIILVFTFVPIIESNSSTANITNTTTKTFGTLAGWLIPTIAIIGLVYLGVRLFLKSGKHG